MIEHEQAILDVLRNDPIIRFDDQDYELVMADKPTCAYGAGEPKTDVYALYRGLDRGDEMEYKISAKKDNFSFLQNHINPRQAESIIGINWQILLRNIAARLFPDDADVPLCYLEGTQKTKPFSLTLGWRVDLTADRGVRSDALIDDDLGKLIVISGRDYDGNSYLSDAQTDPFVCGRVIEDAGLADYMLTDLNLPQTADEIIDHLVSVEEYASRMGTIYATFKAVNERLLDQKHDQNRDLGVYVNWFVNDDGMLDARWDYSEPLFVGADQIADELFTAMDACEIYGIDDLIPGETVNPDICWGAVDGEHFGTAGSFHYQPRLFDL